MLMTPTKTYIALCTTVLIGMCAAVLSASVDDAPQVPYDLEKFRAVLDASKLQAPISSPAMIPHGEFAGQSNEYFHLDETGQYMVFTVTGDSRRAELRQMTGDWQTSTATERRLTARLKVLVPEYDTLNQYTFMQIHDKRDDDTGEGLNKPLIRLTWRRSRSGVRDHLWAGIRIPADLDQPITLENLDSLWVDLGPRPAGFFDAAIRVRDNRMVVTIDGETKIDMDVAYWDGLNSYFKAGTYNQDPGTSVVYFEELAFGEGPEESDSPEYGRE